VIKSRALSNLSNMTKSETAAVIADRQTLFELGSGSPFVTERRHRDGTMTPFS